VSELTSDPAEQAKSIIIRLSDILKSLLPKNFHKDDYSSQLIILHLFRQIDHVQSIVKLDPSMDMVLIARSMIEGAIQLEWILKEDTQTRVRSWFNYACIHNEKLLDHQLKKGVYIPDDEKAKIEKSINDALLNFKNPKKKEGNAHPNFRMGLKLNQLIENNDSLYDLYKFFSEWQHWESRPFAQISKKENDAFHYYEEDHVYRIPAFGAVFICLCMTYTQISNHFKITSHEAAVQKLFEDYNRDVLSW